jgi:NAD(P)-dependent dehydrogenase (short-subunit alcohol dehydrogenase family)
VEQNYVRLDTLIEASNWLVAAQSQIALAQHWGGGEVASADVEKLVEATVQRYGNLDVLDNNVDVAIAGSAADISEDDWDRVININLTGARHRMKYAIPHMLKNGHGSIVNVSSVQGLVGFAGYSGYAASKRQLIMLRSRFASTLSHRELS